MSGDVLVALAAHVLPVGAPPIRGGAVAIDAGRITAVGPATVVLEAVERQAAAGRLRRPAVVRDLGHVALLPGLVNAHTHLELSWLSGRVARASSLPAWVRSLMAERRAGVHEEDVGRAAAMALEAARAAGTVALGDIGNGTSAFPGLQASAFHAVAFHEVIGFAPDDPDRLVDEAIVTINSLPPSPMVRPALAAHAPYSVHPGVLRRLAKERRQHDRTPMSVHLGESREEGEFLSTGRGPWRTLLDDLGAWNPAFEPPGVTPAAYLESLGFLGSGVLAVHGVHLGPGDLERLARLGVTLVTCPRSNQWTGVGPPPVGRFYASGVAVAIGTDSLASNDDLNLFSEMAAMRQIATDVPAARLIESATITGARALGLGADIGSLEPGKLAAVVTVEVPPTTRDVEEYLVNGVGPEHVGWVIPPDAWRWDTSC